MIKCYYKHKLFSWGVSESDIRTLYCESFLEGMLLPKWINVHVGNIKTQIKTVSEDLPKTQQMDRFRNCVATHFVDFLKLVKVF